MYSIDDFLTRFWLRVVNCMHVPRGLADGAGTGSQQAAFTFHLPSSDKSMIAELVQGLTLHAGMKYAIHEQVLRML